MAKKQFPLILVAAAAAGIGAAAGYLVCKQQHSKSSQYHSYYQKANLIDSKGRIVHPQNQKGSDLSFQEAIHLGILKREKPV